MLTNWLCDIGQVIQSLCACFFINGVLVLILKVFLVLRKEQVPVKPVAQGLEWRECFRMEVCRWCLEQCPGCRWGSRCCGQGPLESRYMGPV